MNLVGRLLDSLPKVDWMVQFWIPAIGVTPTSHWTPGLHERKRLLQLKLIYLHEMECIPARDSEASVRLSQCGFGYLYFRASDRHPCTAPHFYGQSNLL